MYSRTRMPGRRALALCCLLLTLAGAWTVEGDAAVHARRSALQTSTKETDSARLVELDAAITTLRGKLAANPTSTRIQANLAAAVSEYDAVSARLGGDRAPLLATHPAAPAEVPLGTNFPPPPNCSSLSGTFSSGTANVPIPVLQRRRSELYGLRRRGRTVAARRGCDYQRAAYLSQRCRHDLDVALRNGSDAHDRQWLR